MSAKFSFEQDLDVEIAKLGEYSGRALCATGVGLSHLLIGATLMPIYLYCHSTGFKDLHIVLCAFGYHFLIVEAIFIMHYGNWTVHLRKGHRRCIFIFLQLCGTACVLAGAVLVTMAGAVSLSTELITEIHELSGLIATGLIILTTSCSPCACVKRHGLRRVHMTFAVLAFITASVCLCFGFLKTKFTEYIDEIIIVYVLIGFVSFYTLFAVSTVCAS